MERVQAGGLGQGLGTGQQAGAPSSPSRAVLVPLTVLTVLAECWGAETEKGAWAVAWALAWALPAS